MPVVAGVESIEIDGVSFDVGDSASYSDQAVEYESLLGQRGKVGDTTKGAAPFIEAVVYLGEGVPVSSVRKRNVTVLLSCADRVVTLSNGTFIGQASPDPTKNSLTARFEGISLKEVF
ncbi:phage tail tube protein [Kiloniella laminariae]|uniref:phage tail tube protein n=1 Tax=Kiloniella laminariae TaxID=454162 RepID=UPI00036D8F2E|nr:phage tail tube protein [Kiloniella laminariae]